MAKRELSSTLKNLKFMQRVTVKDEESKKAEEVVIPDGNFPSSGIREKCRVILEGDPHPGVTKGRMSFQSFNPSIDKLNGDKSNDGQSEPASTGSSNQNGQRKDRENSYAEGEPENSKSNTFMGDASRELKRKQDEVAPEIQHPDRKNVQLDQESSPNNRSSYKQHKREKLDWSVLRPPKGKKKRE